MMVQANLGICGCLNAVAGRCDLSVHSACQKAQNNTCAIFSHEHRAVIFAESREDNILDLIIQD